MSVRLAKASIGLSWAAEAKSDEELAEERPHARQREVPDRMARD
jgi:hypothetical protein